MDSVLPLISALLLAAAIPAMPMDADAQAGREPAPAGASNQRAARYELPVRRAVSGNYLLFLPREYQRGTRRWPLILYLHGGAHRGTDPQRLRQWGLPAVVDRDPSFPFVVLSPQLPAGQLWTDTDALVALLDDVTARYRIDPKRVYVVGHSMGGNGAWFLAYRHPERFAAIAPIAGPGNPWWATRLKDVPAWAFHGDADSVVSVDESRAMVDAIRKEGGADAALTVLPGRGHDILDVFENRELYAWLLRHRRP